MTDRLTDFCFPLNDSQAETDFARLAAEWDRTHKLDLGLDLGLDSDFNSNSDCDADETQLLLTKTLDETPDGESNESNESPEKKTRGRALSTGDRHQLPSAPRSRRSKRIASTTPGPASLSSPLASSRGPSPGLLLDDGLGGTEGETGGGEQDVAGPSDIDIDIDIDIDGAVERQVAEILAAQGRVDQARSQDLKDLLHRLAKLRCLQVGNLRRRAAAKAKAKGKGKAIAKASSSNNPPQPQPFGLWAKHKLSDPAAIRALMTAEFSLVHDANPTRIVRQRMLTTSRRIGLDSWEELYLVFGAGAATERFCRRLNERLEEDARATSLTTTAEAETEEAAHNLNRLWLHIYPAIITACLKKNRAPQRVYPVLALENCPFIVEPKHIPIPATTTDGNEAMSPHEEGDKSDKGDKGEQHQHNTMPASDDMAPPPPTPRPRAAKQTAKGTFAGLSSAPKTTTRHARPTHVVVVNKEDEGADINDKLAGQDRDRDQHSDSDLDQDSDRDQEERAAEAEAEASSFLWSPQQPHETANADQSLDIEAGRRDDTTAAHGPSFSPTMRLGSDGDPELASPSPFAHAAAPLLSRGPSPVPVDLELSTDSSVWPGFLRPSPQSRPAQAGMSSDMDQQAKKRKADQSGLFLGPEHSKKPQLLQHMPDASSPALRPTTAADKGKGKGKETNEHQVETVDGSGSGFGFGFGFGSNGSVKPALQAHTITDSSAPPPPPPDNRNPVDLTVEANDDGNNSTGPRLAFHVDCWQQNIGEDDMRRLADPSAWLSDGVIVPLAEVMTSARPDQFIHIHLYGDTGALLRGESTWLADVRRRLAANPQQRRALATDNTDNKDNDDDNNAAPAQLLVTMNARDSHWMLGRARVRPQKREMMLEVYDSMSSSSSSGADAQYHTEAEKIMWRLGREVLARLRPGAESPLLAPSPAGRGSIKPGNTAPATEPATEPAAGWSTTYELVPCSQQPDQINCGVYALINLVHIVCGRPVPSGDKPLSPAVWRAVFWSILRAKTAHHHHHHQQRRSIHMPGHDKEDGKDDGKDDDETTPAALVVAQLLKDARESVAAARKCAATTRIDSSREYTLQDLTSLSTKLRQQHAAALASHRTRLQCLRAQLAAPRAMLTHLVAAAAEAEPRLAARAWEASAEHSRFAHDFPRPACDRAAAANADDPMSPPYTFSPWVLHAQEAVWKQAESDLRWNSRCARLAWHKSLAATNRLHYSVLTAGEQLLRTACELEQMWLECWP